MKVMYDIKLFNCTIDVDNLTTGKYYEVLTEYTYLGIEKHYFIKNDNGREKYYNAYKFKSLSDVREEKLENILQ
jgi:hypothetical protein